MDTIIVERRDLQIKIGTEPEIMRDVIVLRRMVFYEEEGFGLDVVETPLDGNGIHLVAYHEDAPIACFSIVPPAAAADFGREVGLPDEFVGRAALATKMAILPPFRKAKMASLMISFWHRYLFVPRDYRFAFAVLMGAHCNHERMYEKLVGFSRVLEGGSRYGDLIVMIMDRETAVHKDIARNILDPQIDAFLSE